MQTAPRRLTKEPSVPAVTLKCRQRCRLKADACWLDTMECRLSFLCAFVDPADHPDVDFSFRLAFQVVHDRAVTKRNSLKADGQPIFFSVRRHAQRERSLNLRNGVNRFGADAKQGRIQFKTRHGSGTSSARAPARRTLSPRLAIGFMMAFSNCDLRPCTDSRRMKGAPQSKVRSAKSRVRVVNVNVV